MRSPTRVAAYIDLRYTTRNPTGVDKHIARMVRGLAATPGFGVSVLAPRTQLVGPSRVVPAASSLAGLPVDAIPFSNRQARMLWAASPWPPIDRYCPDVDWIYSPQELWAPAKHARTAVTIHGATYFERAYPGYRTAWARFERARMSWFFSKVCRHADLVISVSPYLESFLIDRFGLDPRRSLVVGNGVDECFYAAGRSEPPTFDCDRILVVGGLNDWDGAAHVLAAADLLHRELPSVTIDIAGTFDDEKYVRAADARPNIRRLGYVESEKLAAMMPGYLALLYLPNVESFGMAAVEAMAAGLPVIACRLTAVPETAGDAAIYVDLPLDAGEKGTGSFCEAKGACHLFSLFAAIETLRDSPAARAAWIARGKARAAAFTWPACIARLVRSLVQSV
jgi:glycosyltransferase involved in cell wall biosynthesis